MVIVGKQRTILIDCVNNAVLRLQKAGVEYQNLTDLILTHFHPDHVSGVPQLLMNMWLLGHKRPLSVYGLAYTLDRIEDLMGFYGWSEWPYFFPVTFYRVPAEELTPVIESEEFRILASPVHHFIPNIGLRMEFLESKKVAAYSCDTEPCEEVIRLAEGADLLIHEASGELPGHSSAAQAGKAARQSEVGSLYLIHYPTGQFKCPNLTQEAREEFEGPILQAEDYMTVEFK